MNTVSFGDKPAGTITTVALRKAAEMMKGRCQKGVEMVLNNLYVDDLIDSFSTEEKAKQVINEVDNIVEYGGFKDKEWTISCKNKDHEKQIVKNEVLGVAWNVM